MRLRVPAVLAATVFALAACTPGPEAAPPLQYSKKGTPTSPSGGGNGGGQRPPGSAPVQPPSGAIGRGDQPFLPPSGGQTPIASYADGGFVGYMARTYLSGAPARALRIEVDRVEGNELPGDAEQHALGVLRRDLVKPDGIQFVRDDVLAGNGRMPRGGGDDIYTFRELHRIAQGSRDQVSQGSTATLHVIVVDGESDEVPTALGVAINASTVVLFAEVIEDAAAPLVGAGQIWRAVLIHELGHLLGLVELLERSETERHSDPDHRGHSPQRDSVMFWAIEDSGITSVLGEGPPTDFDAFDRADLAALRD